MFIVWGNSSFLDLDYSIQFSPYLFTFAFQFQGSCLAKVNLILDIIMGHEIETPICLNY